MKCIFCHSSRYKKVAPKLRDSATHSVVECVRCHLIQQTPLPSIDEDKKFYDAGRQAKNIGLSIELSALRKNQKPDTKRRTEWIIKQSKPGNTLLDIGCGYGFFVEEMRKRKLRPQGIEISETSRRIAKKVTKVKVMNVNLLTDSFDRSYDIVTLFHVLEHVSTPVPFLRRIRSLLNPRGKIFIEVPNLENPLLHCSPAFNYFFWQRAHISYFNGHTLKKLMQSAGFKKINISYTQRYGIENLIHWLTQGRPQLTNPSLQFHKETEQQYGWLEKYYKEYLASHKTADTIIAAANP